MTQLVWNASGQTVADLLGELASNARRILIAVAFLPNYPDRCPVLNGNSLDSLRHLAIGRFPAHPQSFKSEHYKRFTEILTTCAIYGV